MSTPVIDFHIHPVYYEYYGESALNWIKGVHGDKNWQDFYEANCDPKYFVRYLKENFVDYGVIMAELCPAVTGTCSNEFVLKYCEKEDSLIPFASINPYLVSDMGRELQRLIEAGFRGLKMYPTYQHFYPNQPSLYPLYSRAEELQVPVMFHTGSSVFKGARLKYGDPLYLDDVAVDFPGMKIILVHGGRGFWYDRAFFLARLHANVYMEVAGLPPQKLMEYFPELERIADKVLFGSDWPGLTDLKGNIEIIRQLPLSEGAKRKILGVNAALLLNLPLSTAGK
jgi:predicted TIM-barrel fold metal-dependent hydrolase